jgi:hypothetical protein
MQLLPPLHSKPLAQPVVLRSVQVVAQVVAEAQAKLPGQGASCGTLVQTPAPSQVPDEVRTPPAQLMELPQPMPALAGKHWPSLPPVFTAAHAMQLPVQALSQQTPSTHWPDVHWMASAQALPVEPPVEVVVCVPVAVDV